MNNRQMVSHNEIIQKNSPDKTVRTKLYRRPSLIVNEFNASIRKHRYRRRRVTQTFIHRLIT